LFKVSREKVRLSETPGGYTETELPEEAREDEPQADGEDGEGQDAEPAAVEEVDEEALARERAEAIVANAAAEAARVLEEARLRAEELRRDAYDEGFSEGRAAGEERSAAEAETITAEGRAAFERVLAELNGALGSALDEFEVMRGQVKTLIFEIIKKIVNLNHESDDKFFIDVIEGALERVKPEGKLTLNVSEADYERFFPSGSAVFKVDGKKLAATIVKNPSLGLTEIIIDFGDVTVNAGPHTQARRVKAALEKSGGLK
jgi:flagellar assembly protein FliH